MRIVVATPYGWQGVMMSAKIVAGLLAGMGHDVVVYDIDADPPRTFDLVVCYERLRPHWLGKAKKSLLIPNQERFPRGLVPWLKRIDVVLAKTRHAETIFRNLGATTRPIGFCSPDRYDPLAQKDYDKWVHVAGTSTYKGTPAVINAWERNPDLPPLTVLVRWPQCRLRDRPHLKFIQDRVPDDEMIRLQNAAGVHLCPSLAEGWDHALVEAMGTKALVVSTDGPPMNEHVAPERGVLCKVAREEGHHCGRLFWVEEAELARVVRLVRDMPDAEKREKGERARRYFLSLAGPFERRFRLEVENLLRNDGRQAPPAK